MQWLWMRLLFHGVVVIVGAVLSSILSLVVGSVWSFASMALFWIPLMVILPELWRKVTGQRSSVHWVLFLLFLLPVYGCTSKFPGLFELYRQGPTPSIAASDAGLFSSDFAIHFHDGIVQRSYRYLRTTKSYDSRRSSTTTNYYLVAPITVHDWSPSDPVYAWAVYSPATWTRSDGPHWSEENGVGIQCDRPTEEPFREAVRLACIQNGLNSSDNAQLLYWTTSVDQEIGDRWRVILASVVGTYVGWMVVYLGIYIVRGPKRIRDEESET